MKLKTVATYTMLHLGDLADHTVIVVNALRTNAVIITALANGSDRVVAVDTIENALAIKRQFSGFSLLCGAYDVNNKDAYDMSNSPLEYTEDRVRGNLIIHCSTNGSRAINACTAGRNIYIGSIINATAVAKKALELTDDIYLVCSGIDGELSTEDLFAAGCITDRLLTMDPTLETDDTTHLAVTMYREFRDKPLDILSGLKTFDSLMENGWQADVEYCLSEDIVSAVPKFEEGTMTI